MFDFEKLEVYQKARAARLQVLSVIDKKPVSKALNDQLVRSLLSVVLNIAEGSGKFTKADRKNFYSIARGSVYEVTAIIDVLNDDKIISEKESSCLYGVLEEISKMLMGLINSMK